MIVVTGASGLIGRAVAARALRDHANVRMQGRSAEEVAKALYSLKVDTDLEVVELDFKQADQHDYDRLLKGCSTVIHCAGLVHKPQAPAAQYEALNYRATQMLASAARLARVDTFVFLSTSAVYGGGPFVDVKEESTTTTDTPYAVSKLRCEEYLNANQPAEKTIILRPSLVFGEGDRGNMLSLIRQIHKGLYFHIGGNTAMKSLIYAADVAGAIDHCVNELPAGYHILNLANPQPYSVIDLANDISASLGKLPPPTVPEAFVRAGAMLGGVILGDKSPLTVQKMDKLMTTTTVSVKKLMSSTGFKPSVSVLDGVWNEVHWARNNGLFGPTEVKKTDA